MCIISYVYIVTIKHIFEEFRKKNKLILFLLLFNYLLCKLKQNLGSVGSLKKNNKKKQNKTKQTKKKKQQQQKHTHTHTQKQQSKTTTKKKTTTTKNNNTILV